MCSTLCITSDKMVQTFGGLGNKHLLQRFKTKMLICQSKTKLDEKI